MSQEARNVGSLLRLAIDRRFLSSSIYSCPLGDRHLERALAASENGAMNLRVRVVRAGHSVVGCTIVSVHAGNSHLDYIAVDPAHAGSGIGSDLLEDALTAAVGGLSLDVFRANHSAHAWYLRKGFLEHGSRTLQVVDLLGLGRVSGLGDRHVQSLVADAREAELAYGFGEFEVIIDGLRFRFSLLGETVVRLLESPPGALKCGATIARSLVPERLSLVLPIGQEEDGLPTLFQDELIRMIAPL